MSGATYAPFPYSDSDIAKFRVSLLSMRVFPHSDSLLLSLSTIGHNDLESVDQYSDTSDGFCYNFLNN